MRIAGLAVITIAFGGIHCFGGQRAEELAEELENTTLITYQLLDENDRLKKKVKYLESRSGGGFSRSAPAEPTGPIDDAAPLEESKRKLFTMRMRVMNFQLTNDKFPETVQELKEVMGDIPTESRSRSNVVHLSRNGRGGWIYDPDEGTLDINTYRRR